VKKVFRLGSVTSRFPLAAALAFASACSSHDANVDGQGALEGGAQPGTGGQLGLDGGAGDALGGGAVGEPTGPESGARSSPEAASPPPIPKGDDAPLPSGTFLADFVGNTFGATWPTETGVEKHVQQSVLGMFVSPQGTVYTNSGWDEGGIDAGIYQNGQVVGRLSFGAGSWGRDGDGPITANAKYVFVAMHQDGGIGNQGNPNGLANEPASGSTWHCVERYDLTGAPAPFSTGLGWDGAMLVVNTSAPVAGLAADGSHVYVADPASGKVLVYDQETLAATGSFSAPGAGQLGLGPDGSLWMVQTGQIVHLTTSGGSLPETITFPASMKPTSFAIDGQGKLAVTDAGQDNDVKVYDTSSLSGSPTQPLTTFGLRGGLPAAGGAIGDARFYQPSGVGFDASGNIYVASNVNAMGASSGVTGGAGAVLESYVLGTGTRNASWPSPLRGLLWLDVGDLDPATEVDLYFPDKHLVYQYGDAVGQGWFWTGFTIDPYRYPSDPRLFATSGGSAIVRHLGGQTFVFSVDQYAGMLIMLRKDPSTEVLIPCGYYVKNGGPGAWSPLQPKGESVWLDANGDGAPQADEFSTPGASAPPQNGWALSVDTDGTIYTSAADGTIRALAFGGLSANGSPKYDFAALQTVAPPAGITSLERIEYQTETDTMFLGAYTQAHPQTGTEWGIVGTEVLVFPHWSKGNRTASASAVLPYDPSSNLFAKSLAIAGDYIFAREVISSTVHMYSTADGTANALTLSTPSSMGHVGWTDMVSGFQAHKRQNGEYFVVAEDDGSIRQLVYRWMP
jgi:hypothetical protein